jgi:alkaline phosphatase D
MRRRELLPLLAQPFFAQIKHNPFPLGIASGEPSPDGFVLWTRLLPADPKPISLTWQLASDESFSKIIRTGEAVASADTGHAVHVEISGLPPDQAGRWYWYRFLQGPSAKRQSSPIGRTKTLPASGASTSNYRFAVASCQKWQDGHFTAYRHMAGEDLDAILHLGDYIYETTSKANTPRPHSLAEARTLADYRDRYALYKSDPDLQEAHRLFPWLVTWDDHETADNYANLIPDWDSPKETFPQRRAAAYRAYYENMPLRARQKPQGHHLTLYRHFDIGTLARVCLLDTRQYRDDQPCGDKAKPPCAEQRDPKRTMLGATQEQWLFRTLAKSPAQWDVLAQQVIFAQLDLDPGPGEIFPMDKWDGYPAARQRILDFFATHKTQKPKLSPVVLTGDNHNHWAFHLKKDEKFPVLASEFAGTSITSNGDGAEVSEEYGAALKSNPHLLFHNSRRGYLSCELKPQSYQTHYRVVPYVSRPGAPLETKASFTIERGNPAAVKS